MAKGSSSSLAKGDDTLILQAVGKKFTNVTLGLKLGSANKTINSTCVIYFNEIHIVHISEQQNTFIGLIDRTESQIIIQTVKLSYKQFYNLDLSHIWSWAIYYLVQFYVTGLLIFSLLLSIYSLIVRVYFTRHIVQMAHVLQVFKKPRLQMECLSAPNLKLVIRRDFILR